MTGLACMHHCIHEQIPATVSVTKPNTIAENLRVLPIPSPVRKEAHPETKNCFLTVLVDGALAIEAWEYPAQVESGSEGSLCGGSVAFETAC